MSDWEEKTRLTTKVATSGERSRPEERDRPYLLVLAGPNVGEMYPLDRERTVVVGRNPECEIRVLSDGISRRHAQIVAERRALFIEDLGSTNGTFVNGERLSNARRALDDGDKLQFGDSIILKFALHDGLEETFQRQMYESALRDGLTKIFNKKYFLDRIESELAFVERHATPLSLILFDIDHFKKVNDTFGHLAGDHVLRSMTAAVSQTIRQEDVFARYGGEEFAVISREVPLAGAVAFGERLRKIVEALRMNFQGTMLEITISVGVAALPDATVHGPDDLIEHADRALYQAKREGRNRVIAHPQDLGR